MSKDIHIDYSNFPVLTFLRSLRIGHEEDTSVSELDYFVALIIMHEWATFHQIRVVPHDPLQEAFYPYSIGITSSPVIFIEDGDDYHVYGWESYAYDAAYLGKFRLRYVDTITPHSRPLTSADVYSFGTSFHLLHGDDTSKSYGWFNNLSQVNTILHYIPEKHCTDVEGLRRYVKLLGYQNQRKKRVDPEYTPDLDTTKLEEFLEEV